jgi:hypothetical protein
MSFKLTQEDYEPKLSFVSLDDDNKTILLNGEAKYFVALPVNISRKNAAIKKDIIEKLILDGCDKFKVDYVSEDNINNRAKEVVDQLYERPRAARYVAPPSDSIITSAPYKNDYLEYLIDCVKKTVKEEDALVRQVLITALSAYTPDPINLAVIAPTSAGKTYPILESTKFGPREDITIVGSMSPRVLVRQAGGILVDKDMNPIKDEVKELKKAIAKAKKKKDPEAVEEFKEQLSILLEGSAYVLDLTNKTLLFLEPPKPELWELVKPILSHDAWEIEHPFVDKVASGEMLVKRVITRGFPSCIFCSAKDESKREVWAEIASRFMVQSPNMVKPKFQAGNKLIFQKKGLPNAAKQQLIISDKELELGKQCFNYLKYQVQTLTGRTDSPVWIPFGERLADILPADKGPDNRAANRLSSIINMLAISKAHLRDTLVYGNERLVIATLEDLREALYIVQNVSGIPPHKVRFYEQYIIPLYSAKKVPLKSRDIVDFYNANCPKGAPKINTDAVNRTYLEELVNSSYVDREPDPDDKRGYIYLPLVDIEQEEGEGEEKKEKVSQISQSSHCDNFLHISKLFLPENHTGIPKNWLNQEILQLQKYRIEPPIFKILRKVPEEKEIIIDKFITEYEKLQNLADFFKKHPTQSDTSNHREIATSGGSEGSTNEENTTNDDKRKKKLSQSPNCDNCDISSEVIKKAMLDQQGNDKGYFTLDHFVFAMQMIPNERWTENEAEQTLYALLEEGKIQEIEPGTGKFEPTTNDDDDGEGEGGKL